MFRVLLTIVLPLLLPTALYLAWVRTTQPAEDAVEKSAKTKAALAQLRAQ